jgi:hypothetical protein
MSIRTQVQQQFRKSKSSKQFAHYYLLLTALCLLYSVVAHSQGTSTETEIRYLVDAPTAGMLTKNDWGVEMNFFQNGGVLTSVSLGLFRWATVGVSFGGTNIVGTGDVKWNKLPGVQLRFRVVEENVRLPALVLGFDSQGKESYIDSAERYTVKSPGVFVAVSKNYSLLGYLSFHGGVNYSLEQKDGDKDLNAFVGIEKTIGSVISVVVEYNAGLNDNNSVISTNKSGFLNAGVKLAVDENFTVELYLRNLLKDNKFSVDSRAIKIEYVGAF